MQGVWQFIKAVEGPGLVVCLIVIVLQFRHIDKLTDRLTQLTDSVGTMSNLLNLLCQSRMQRGS